MGIILIFAGALLGIILITFVAHLMQLRSRRHEYKDWEVNDLLILSDRYYIEKLKDNGRKYARVQGWNENDLYIDVGDGNTYKVEWKVIDINKSALWRRNYKECENAMGKKPAFSSVVANVGISSDSVSNGDMIDGKPIVLLAEIECQAYLKQALDTEDYDTAEKIRIQMEKYR